MAVQESRSFSAREFFVAYAEPIEPLGLKQRACDLFGDGSRFFLEQLPGRRRVLSNRGAYRDDEQPIADPTYYLLAARVTNIGRTRNRLIPDGFQGDRRRRTQRFVRRDRIVDVFQWLDHNSESGIVFCGLQVSEHTDALIIRGSLQVKGHRTVQKTRCRG